MARRTISAALSPVFLDSRYIFFRCCSVRCIFVLFIVSLSYTPFIVKSTHETNYLGAQMLFLYSFDGSVMPWVYTSQALLNTHKSQPQPVSSCHLILDIKPIFPEVQGGLDDFRLRWVGLMGSEVLKPPNIFEGMVITMPLPVCGLFACPLLILIL